MKRVAIVTNLKECFPKHHRFHGASTAFLNKITENPIQFINKVFKVVRWANDANINILYTQVL